MTLYADPIIEKIITLIDASDGGAITTFYHGDPIFVAKDNLPALCISKDNTNIGDASNAEDYHQMTIVLTLIVDIRQFFGDTPINIQLGDQAMYNIIEGRDSDYTLKSTSIVDILRSNSNLLNNAHIDLETPMTADYGFTFGKRGENVWAWEATLTVPVYYTQLR